MTLVENLRRYVGEQVPPEVHSQAWESERQELLETVQVRECPAWDGTRGLKSWARGPGEEHSPQEKRQCHRGVRRLGAT